MPETDPPPDARPRAIRSAAAAAGIPPAAVAAFLCQRDTARRRGIGWGFTVRA